MTSVSSYLEKELAIIYGIKEIKLDKIGYLFGLFSGLAKSLEATRSCATGLTAYVYQGK